MRAAQALSLLLVIVAFALLLFLRAQGPATAGAPVPRRGIP
jgi:hypothetical protein